MELDTERLQVFLQSLDNGSKTDERLLNIKKEARNDQVPIIRDEMADLLAFLMKLIRPERVLEVGCAVGYSALLMRENLSENASITTIELDGARAEKARANFALMSADNIFLHEGDAGSILKTLPDEEYDVVFMDAAKGQYLTWLSDVRRVLKKGGVLITDNVLFDGDVLMSRYGVVRRDRTIHTRLREYLRVLKNTPGLSTAVINVGDGAALTIKEY